MEFYVIAFILGVVVSYMVLRYEGGLSSNLLDDKIKGIQNRIKAIEDNNGRVNNSLESLSIKINETKNIVDRVKTDCTDLENQSDETAEFCMKLKSQVFDLHERLSKLRPVIKMQGSVPVQVLEKKETKKSIGRGVEAVIGK